MPSNNNNSNFSEQIFNKFNKVTTLIPQGDILQFLTHLTEAFKENQTTQRELAKIQATKEILLTEITSKYALYRDVFETIFEERNNVINKYFSIIDQGIQKNDKELISLGLQSLSKVVTASPFTDIDQLSKALGSNNIIEI